MDPKIIIPILFAVALLGALSRGQIRIPIPTIPARSGVVSPPVIARPAVQKPSGSWVASERPAGININNVNAQGSGIPINIGTSGPETVVVDSGPGLVPPIGPIFEPINLHFSGPADPERLMGMLIALMIAVSPLVLDWARDWPTRSSTTTDYLQPFYHYLLLGLFFIFALYTADQQFGLAQSYGPSAVSAVTGFEHVLGPTLVAAVEGSERLVWTVEDMVFGDSRHILGIVIAMGLMVMVTMRTPFEKAPKTSYGNPPIQFLYLFGIMVVGMLLWNA